MSRPYELVSTIRVSAPQGDLDVLIAVLEDEEKRIGSRACYSAHRAPDTVEIEVHASDATALKTAISAISAIIKTTEEMNMIGEHDGTTPTSARDPR